MLLVENISDQIRWEGMTSFNDVMIPTRGNGFQTNSLERESEIVLIFSVCFTNDKDTAVQSQI